MSLSPSAENGADVDEGGGLSNGGGDGACMRSSGCEQEYLQTDMSSSKKGRGEEPSSSSHPSSSSLSCKLPGGYESHVSDAKQQRKEGGEVEGDLKENDGSSSLCVPSFSSSSSSLQQHDGDERRRRKSFTGIGTEETEGRAPCTSDVSSQQGTHHGRGGRKEGVREEVIVSSAWSTKTQETDRKERSDGMGRGREGGGGGGYANATAIGQQHLTALEAKVVGFLARNSSLLMDSTQQPQHLSSRGGSFASIYSSSSPLLSGLIRQTTEERGGGGGEEEGEQACEALGNENKVSSSTSSSFSQREKQLLALLPSLGGVRYDSLKHQWIAECEAQSQKSLSSPNQSSSSSLSSSSVNTSGTSQKGPKEEVLVKEEDPTQNKEKIKIGPGETNNKSINSDKDDEDDDREHRSRSSSSTPHSSLRTSQCGGEVQTTDQGESRGGDNHQQQRQDEAEGRSSSFSSVAAPPHLSSSPLVSSFGEGPSSSDDTMKIDAGPQRDDKIRRGFSIGQLGFEGAWLRACEERQRAAEEAGDFTLVGEIKKAMDRGISLFQAEAKSRFESMRALSCEKEQGHLENGGVYRPGGTGEPSSIGARDEERRGSRGGEGGESEPGWRPPSSFSSQRGSGHLLNLQGLSYNSHTASPSYHTSYDLSSSLGLLTPQYIVGGQGGRGGEIIRLSSSGGGIKEVSTTTPTLACNSSNDSQSSSGSLHPSYVRKPSPSPSLSSSSYYPHGGGTPAFLSSLGEVEGFSLTPQQVGKYLHPSSLLLSHPHHFIRSAAHAGRGGDPVTGMMYKTPDLPLGLSSGARGHLHPLLTSSTTPSYQHRPCLQNLYGTNPSSLLGSTSHYSTCPSKSTPPGSITGEVRSSSIGGGRGGGRGGGEREGSTTGKVSCSEEKKGSPSSSTPPPPSLQPPLAWSDDDDEDPRLITGDRDHQGENEGGRRCNSRGEATAAAAEGEEDLEEGEVRKIKEGKEVEDHRNRVKTEEREEQETIRKREMHATGRKEEEGTETRGQEDHVTSLANHRETESLQSVRRTGHSGENDISDAMNDDDVCREKEDSRRRSCTPHDTSLSLSSSSTSEG